MEEKVDILMATYNTEIKYLKEQIDSILNQTYTNINLIISDDNSSKQEVKDVLKSYEKQDDRVKLYLQEKNLGYIKNFGFLLEKSEANYIMYADHDDIWYKEKVKKSLDKLQKDDASLVYVNSKQIDEEGKVIKEDYFKYKNVPLIDKYSHLAISRCIGIGCSQIFTKSVRDKMIPFKNSVMAHDWLAPFIANNQKGISYIEEPLFGYRLHNSNVFGGRNLSQNLDRWKKKNGDNYKSYLKYRKEKVIDKAYLDGAIMCSQYLKDEENEIKEKTFDEIKFLEKLVNYYEDLKRSKYINLKVHKYFKFLSGKNMFKKAIKEIIIFHFPIIGYMKFKMG